MKKNIDELSGQVQSYLIKFGEKDLEAAFREESNNLKILNDLKSEGYRDFDFFLESELNNFRDNYVSCYGCGSTVNILDTETVYANKPYHDEPEFTGRACSKCVKSPHSWGR